MEEKRNTEKKGIYKKQKKKTREKREQTETSR